MILNIAGASRQQLLKRTVFLLGVGIVVAVGGWGYLFGQGQGDAPVYRLARVERGPLVAAVSAAGNLNAVITVQVGTQVSGQIKELHADFNSLVRTGQVIARIDPAAFEAKVKQARADLDAAKYTALNGEAQVERARADVGNARSALAEGKAQTAHAQVVAADTGRDLGRKRELFQRALISKSEYDAAQVAHDAARTLLDAAQAKEDSLAGAIEAAQAQVRVAEATWQVARAQVEQKKAALDQTELDLEHTTIRAPVDGVVVSRAVDVGQTVAASLSAPTLFTIARDLTKMQVEANVNEADIGRVRVNGAAKFTVDAFPDEPFRGRIVQVRKAPQIAQSVVTYSVIVAVDNPDGKLLPGMTANVELIVAEEKNVLQVPNAALRFRPPVGDRPKVEGLAQGGDGQESLASRAQLVRRLGLTAAQQAKLNSILDDDRRPKLGPPGAGPAQKDRPGSTPEFGEAARPRIRQILTAEQRGRYDQLAAEDRPGGTPGQVWTLGAAGKLHLIALTLGLTDGNATEVRGGDLTEGQEVVIGLARGRSGKHPTARKRSLGFWR
jgi:HlyD family secretion protein